MSSYIHENFNFINISFKKPIFKDFKNLYFKPDESIKYYDQSHLNYIYIQTLENINYTFHGFYKDTYFVIAIDSHNEDLNTAIEHKELIIIKTNWNLKKVAKDKSLWILDVPPYIKEKKEFFILPIRKKILDSQNNILSIDDYLKINLFDIDLLEIKLTEEDNEPQSYKNMLALIPFLFIFKYSRSKRISEKEIII